VLATLSALGVSEELQSKVQDAIQQLEQLASNTLSGGPAVASAAHSSKHVAPSSKSHATAATSSGTAPKTQTTEAKLQMSRSIMRKLHHKNVALEKELQVCVVYG